MTSFLDRLRGRTAAPPRYAKAVTNLGPWATGIPLSSLANTPQEKAAAYLKAYRVGWFYKAGSKIARDVSTLDWSVSDGDAEEGEAETTLDRPDLRIPFRSLAPIDQFQRLLERPNPSYTGRQLLQKTEIRLDFAGAAAWYLEGATQGLPKAIYGISPARMWPSYDKAGNLIGWVMDKDAPSGGVPFDKREILWFTTGNAEDDDIWGTSVVEAVYAQVPLSELAARHTANVLTTGGRLAGMLWPKERALSEDEFADAQRAWRNVASDPNAGKRLLIFPEPMEYASGASTPAEIGIPELAVLNRDEILTAFPISPYQLGVPTPGGLNSGEVRREDRRDYWEGTIHPRADLLEEFIQVGLLSLYEEATNTTYDFEIAEPDLDDAERLTAKAAAFKELVGIGLDPEESLKAVELAHIKFLGLPALIDPVAQAQAQQEAQEAQVEALRQRNEAPPPAKAVKSRDDIASEGALALADFLEGQQARVISAIRDTLPAKSKRADFFTKADPDWWNAKQEDDLLANALRVIYTSSGKGSLQVVADRLDRIVPNKAVQRVVADLLAHGGERIADINARTLQALSIELAEGARRGYSISQLIEGVPDEGYKGVKGVTLDNGTPVFADARAETIARTETALSYNRAALDAYREFNVSQVLAYDGDDDPECAERNGQVFDLDDAFAIDDHPNGTLDWAPVTDGGKSYHEPMVIENHIHMPEMKAADVHVEGPHINVEAPVINLPEPVKAESENVNQTFIIGDREAIKALEVPEPPVVNVAQPDLTPVLDAIKALAEREQPAPEVHVKAEMPREMRITSMPTRVTRKRVQRDGKGRVSETDEIESDE